MPIETQASNMKFLAANYPKLPRVVLRRESSSDEGTPGKLETNTGFACYTLELPWRGNRRRLSCVPAGEYLCQIKASPRFGEVYELIDVPGRNAVLIHAGNLAGDVEQGLLSDVQGCILLGAKAGQLYGQRALLQSKATLANFLRAMSKAPFILQIKEVAP